MTLGTKLAFYRKNKDITQQQLGEMLNISAQAVSKWENDLAEPDLSTIRKLAELYGISTDDLLDYEKEEKKAELPDTDAIVAGVSEAVREKIGTMNAHSETIGFCTSCGVSVTQETLGEREPKVLCAACLDKKQKEEKRAQEAREAEENAKKEKEKRTKEAREQRVRSLTGWSLFLSIAAAVITVLVCGLSIQNGWLIGGIGAVFAFFFAGQLLFEDYPVRNVLEWCTGCSIHWPGLIFAWNIDGFVWVICMKLLFAVLGFLFGILMFLVGVVVSALISPFTYPFVMRGWRREVREGEFV